MPNLVHPEVAGELLNTNAGAIMTIASVRLKANGIHPTWYISDRKKGANVCYVDVEIIERYNLIRKRAWNYATESLYWLITEIEGYKLKDISDILAKETGETASSWYMYMSRDLWNIPQGNCYELKQTKLFNFIRIMTRWIYENKNSLKFKEA